MDVAPSYGDLNVPVAIHCYCNKDVQYFMLTSPSTYFFQFKKGISVVLFSELLCLLVNTRAAYRMADLNS